MAKPRALIPDLTTETQRHREYNRLAHKISVCLLCASASLWLGPLLPGVTMKKKIAGITTVYHRNSHADVILGKILEGYLQDGGPGPNLQLVSLYVDQHPEKGDLSGELANKHG